jgi:hypothetical protein
MTMVLTVAALLVMGWFAAGTIWNIRKGSAAMRWLQGGLPLVGERTTVRWLGTTAVEMVIQKAKPPFEEVAVVIFLEPRDLPWMWALSRRRGRRDTLIVRARLRRAPQADLEVLDRESWSGRDALRRMASEPWSVREPQVPGGLPVYYKTPAALASGDALVDLASRTGVAVRRLSVRRTEPNLQLHLALPDAATPASELFRALRTLAERAEA